MKDIILASQSPRRRELLENIGLKFEIMVDNSPEDMSGILTISELVKKLSAKKAANVSDKLSGRDCIIISADTVVSIDDKVIGKPMDRKNSIDVLKSLSGNSHYVYTGITVLDNKSGKIVSDFEKTEVTFRKLSDKEITDYVNTGEPMDKAGSYGIQGKASLFVEKIDGDYFNIVGLPICKLGKILKDEFGVNLINV